MQLEDLTNIEFHDLPVESVYFDDEKETIEIVVSVPDEKNNGYQEKLLLFNKITDLKITGSIFNNNREPSEIYDAHLEENEGIFFLKLLLYHGSITSVVEFKFVNLLVEDR